MGNRGFTAELENCISLQQGSLRNAEARERIISSLGGDRACAAIPSAAEHPDFARNINENLALRLRLGERYFRSGQSIIQGEDHPGRKFVALRLYDRTMERICVVTAHQIERETSIALGSDVMDGRNWTLAFDRDGLPDILRDTNAVAEFLTKVVRERNHERFELQAM